MNLDHELKLIINVNQGLTKSSASLVFIINEPNFSLPNIENYVSARENEKYNLKALLKYMPVFVSFSLFKIIAIAYICLFFNAAGLIFLAGTIAVLFILNNKYVSMCCQCTSILSWLNLVEDGENKMDEKEKEEVDRHYKESFILGWITMTNLESKLEGDSKALHERDVRNDVSV